MKDRDVFNIFANSHLDNFALANKVEELLELRVKEVQREENLEFYDTLRILINSINNAGCEERRSEQIAFIRKKMNTIEDTYAAFLC